MAAVAVTATTGVNTPRPHEIYLAGIALNALD
jgi:hypothetical protein